MDTALAGTTSTAGRSNIFPKINISSYSTQVHEIYKVYQNYDPICCMDTFSHDKLQRKCVGHYVMDDIEKVRKLTDSIVSLKNR